VKLTVDTDAQTLCLVEGDTSRTIALYSPQAFELLAQQWLRVGWSQKYSYRFTWLGRPIVQLPEDLLRIQEVIQQLKPDVIVETGIAHGGSLIFYASLCHALGNGHVVGIDISIRPANRAAIEAHPLHDYITLVEGSSTDTLVLDTVRAVIGDAAKVIVILDSNHSYAHVAAELRAYAPLITLGSYLVVQDGVMALLADVPGGQPDWTDNNPAAAARDFLSEHAEFVQSRPPHPFDESRLERDATYWTDGWLRRRA
jgi:cephalosporin hydroxylase